MRCAPHEVYARNVHASEMYAHETHAYGTNALEMYAPKVLEEPSVRLAHRTHAFPIEGK